MSIKNIISNRMKKVDLSVDMAQYTEEELNKTHLTIYFYEEKNNETEILDKFEFSKRFIIGTINSINNMAGSMLPILSTVSKIDVLNLLPILIKSFLSSDRIDVGICIKKNKLAKIKEEMKTVEEDIKNTKSK